MSGELDVFWVHSVPVETFQGSGAYGDVFAAPANISCFLDGSSKLVRNQAGEEVVSSATIYAPSTAATVLTVDSRVTVNGRKARVLAVNTLDAAGLGLPDHIEANLD